MSDDPDKLARRRSAAARQALAEADAASRRLQEVRRRALQLLGETADAADPETYRADALDARMHDIERRMRDTEAMIRRAEAGLGRRIGADAFDAGDDGWGR